MKSAYRNADGTITITGDPVLRRFGALTASGTAKRYGIDVPVYDASVDATLPDPPHPSDPAWTGCQLHVVRHWDSWGEASDFDWRWLGGASDFGWFGGPPFGLFADTVSADSELIMFADAQPRALGYDRVPYPESEMDVLDFADRARVGSTSDGETKSIPGTDIPGDPFYNVNSFWGDSYVWVVEPRSIDSSGHFDQTHPGCYFELGWNTGQPRNSWEWGEWRSFRVMTRPATGSPPVFYTWTYDDRPTSYSEYISDIHNISYTPPPGPPPSAAPWTYGQLPDPLSTLTLRAYGPLVFRMISRFVLVIEPTVTIPADLGTGVGLSGQRPRGRVTGTEVVGVSL